MKRHSCALLIGLALFFASAASAQPEPLIVDVNCDAGDDLAEAVHRAEALAAGSGANDDEGSDVPAEGPRAIVVNITGTCEANVVLTMHETTLRGVGGGPATIQGAEDPSGNSSPYGVPVVDARSIQNLHLENLNVTGGWFGVRLVSSLAVIDDCVFSDNGTGLQSENSVSIVNRSRFEQNRTGIFTFGGDHLLLQHSVVADNEQEGVGALGSYVSIVAGEIRGNRFGLRLGGRAMGFLLTDLRIQSPISVIDGSQLAMHDSVEIAGDGRVFVGNQSLFEAYGGTIEVDVILARWGRAHFTSTPIDGEVVLYDFSEVRTDGEISDLAYCDETSDLVCEKGTVGAVLGCEHCDGPEPAGSASDAGATSPGGPGIRKLIEDLLAPVEGRIDGGTSGSKAVAPAPVRGIQGR